MVMKKFLNNPDNVTTELLEGYKLAYSDRIDVVSEKIVVRAKPKAEDKVAIISMGGAGHEPAISGYVGEGMLDASVVGDIFAAPGAPKVLEALEMFDRKAGVILVVLNHAGDIMSSNMALQLAARKNLNVKSIVTCEDISAGIDTPKEDKRGLGGCIPLFKAMGAAAEQGKSIDEIMEIGERFNNHMATLAVAMSGATHPQNGMQISELPDDEMEIGMGQHGEAGGGRSKLLSADETAELMIKQLMKAVEIKSGDTAALYVNGSGATTLMEQFLIYRKAFQVLESAGIKVVPGKVEEMLTVQEAGGFQLILCKIDADHVELLAAPSNAPYWSQS